MNWALDVGLPLSLLIIILSLGLDLEVADFRRVLTRRTAFAQITMVPIVALTITLVFIFPSQHYPMALFLIVTVPIILGIIVRCLSMNVATQVNRLLAPVSLVLFVVIVITALATNWQIFIDNVGTMGTGLLLMCAILLMLGLLLSRLAGLSKRDARTI